MHICKPDDGIWWWSGSGERQHGPCAELSSLEQRGSQASLAPSSDRAFHFGARFCQRDSPFQVCGHSSRGHKRIRIQGLDADNCVLRCTVARWQCPASPSSRKTRLECVGRSNRTIPHRRCGAVDTVADLFLHHSLDNLNTARRRRTIVRRRSHICLLPRWPPIRPSVFQLWTTLTI